jgi:hypothetical protein
MAVQSQIFDRRSFLAVLGLENHAFNQRAYRGEIALAFGLSKPGHVNEYGELDMFAVMLTFFIAHFLKIDMANAAGLVREHWRKWLNGLAQTERMARRPYNEKPCFVVATNPDKSKIEVAVGPCQETIAKVDGADMVAFPLPLDVMLKELRRGAKEAGINLPKVLTPAAPDSPEYAQWISDIEDYRQFAANRRTSRKRAPARKRQLLTT